MRYGNKGIEFRVARFGDLVLLPIDAGDLRISRAVQIGKELRFGYVEAVEYFDGSIEEIEQGRLKVTISAPTAYDIWVAIKGDSLFEPRYRSVIEFTRTWIKAGLIREAKAKDAIERAKTFDAIIKREMSQTAAIAAST